ncbi:MAG: GspH/FimT family protein [Gammaproteobacteria bacterium]|nr:GspH/FimT family protein [Gammaproteobacteria bacterium]
MNRLIPVVFINLQRHMPVLHKKKNDGFSLIDVLVTIVLISIILWTSTTGIVTYFSHRKQYLFMQQLYHDLKWARIESIVLSQSIRVASDGDWCHGWVVDDQETQHIFKRHEGIENCRIDFSSFPSLTYFQFSPRGRSDEQNATFTFFDQNQKIMRIIINKAGRVRWE